MAHTAPSDPTAKSRRTAAARRSPGQWGTIQHLPSGRWRAFYRFEGRRISAPSTFPTKDAASAWLAAEHADRARGSWRDPEVGRITLAEYASDWLAARPDLAPRTFEYYSRTVDQWIIPRIGTGDRSRGVELGAMHVADLSPAVVRAWYAVVLQSSRERASARVDRRRARDQHPARVWAVAAGQDVPATGRPSAAMLAAWQAAGSPVTVSPRNVADRPGDSAAANAYRVLRGILSTAVTDGLLAANPCVIKGAGTTRARERGTATPAEVERLAAHMPRHLAAAVTVAAWSGLRYGELFALARRHIDLEAGTLHVERTIQQVSGQPIAFGPTKTAKSRRLVHLPRSVVAALEQHLAEFVGPSAGALVFTLSNGAPVTSSRLSAMFGKARAVIGREDLTWHDLRHTGATLAYRIGASVPDVQKRLGHTTMRAAQIYAHAADDSDQLLAERLDALIGVPAGSGRRLRAI
ncbi:site-specific integrase [uncultured Microbacterium sp.]|uniref:Phage integrase n=1 Tax=uncultured Microbacterium sp. TaxID=191216 RepID=A0A1Y5NZS2_9MICO|nr:site-specific integrase [uncultured Microbacterium sp.]SBS70800.1 Phage integrase [uncultured Microbacterium sp.]